MKLADFDVLSFDCYGTLIDWESGIYAGLAPLLARSTVDLSRDGVLEAFARLEVRQQETTPDMIYSALLAEVHGQLAGSWGLARNPDEDAAFGRDDLEQRGQRIADNRGCGGECLHGHQTKGLEPRRHHDRHRTA